ncbi:MAG TPA: ferritin-like domain-containing protein [Candidatus Koribacter sp.]|jgi:bacterioferritin
MPHFVEDVEEIRQRASQKIEDGAVTDSLGPDVEKTIEILNEALATEIVCVLRYMHHYFMATGVHGKSVSGEFKEHADEEREHADMIAERIQQLGGAPDYNPKTLLQRSVSHYVEGETLADMIKEDLIAERVVIEVYQKMIEYFGMKDPTTRRMIEHIKEQEEEHASDLSDLLFIVNPHTGKEEGEDPGANPLQKQTGTGRVDAQRNQETKTEDHQNRSASGKESMPTRENSKKAPEPFAGRGTVVEPAHQPGTGGRTMNRRGNRDEIETDDSARRPNAGASQGSNRSARVTSKNRKKNVA